jgi:hypothetical protein
MSMYNEGMTRPRTLSGIALLAIASVAFAQSSFQQFDPGVPGGPGIPGIPGSGALREVVPGSSDVDPLRVSQQYIGGYADLRSPLGFERIYVGADGRFYRMSGSLVAAFDRSAYVADANGVYPEVPAGTVYYTGGLPPEALGNGQPLELLPTASTRQFARVGGAVNGSATARAGAGSPANSGTGGIGYRSGSVLPTPREDVVVLAEPTMATDEKYRASRMAVLLRRASDSPND